jgi:transposase
MQKSKKIVEGKRDKFVIDLRDSTQTRYEMVRELTLSSEAKEKICRSYGYTRASGHIYEKAWQENRWEGLKDKPKGPQRNYVRTEDVEQKVLSIRFKHSELDMYDIRDLLKNEGEVISARSIARILSKHGVTLKKTRKLASRV